MSEMASAIPDAETFKENVSIFFHIQHFVQSIRIGGQHSNFATQPGEAPGQLIDAPCWSAVDMGRIKRRGHLQDSHFEVA
jgi:hypothetical protein